MATKKRKKAHRITDDHFEQIWKAAREGDDRKRCPRGHDLTKIENAHRSETARTGRVRCKLCWRISAGLEKPKKKAAKIPHVICAGVGENPVRVGGRWRKPEIPVPATEPARNEKKEA